VTTRTSPRAALQREMVSQYIRNALVKRAENFFIELDDISITHLTFGREFTQGSSRTREIRSCVVSSQARPQRWR
jgi:hypothetical protein